MASRKRLWGLALLIGVPAAASSQDAPERLTTIGSRTELVQVDVIVTDRRGRPVTNLTRDDFEVLEDGRPVEVAAFRPPDPAPTSSAEPAPSAAPEPPRRAEAVEPATIVLYLENATLTPGGRRQVLEAMRSVIGARLPLGAFRALVIAEAAGARTLTKLTTSVAEVESVLDDVARTTVGGAPARSDERQVLGMIRAIIEACEQGGACGSCLDVLDEVLAVARAHAEARTRALSQIIARLSAAVEALGTLSGRKAVVYASGDFEQRPGTHLFHQIGEICPQALHKDFSRVYGPMDEYDVSMALFDLAARANAARVTFYPLDAGGLQGHSLGDASHDARRYTPSPHTDSLRAASIRATQELLAQETGGFAIVNTNDPSELLARLPDELAARYDLGFVPAREPDGRRHSIRVRLRHAKGLKVRYRASYLHAPRATREGDRALATLLYGWEEDSLGAIVTAELAPASPGRQASRAALVRIAVPLASLSQEADGDGRRVRLRILLAIRRLDAAPTDAPEVRAKVVALSLPPEGPTPASHDLVVDVPLGEGEHDLAVGILDALSSAASYRRLRLR